MIGEKPRQYVATIICSRGAAEFYAAKLLTVSPRPTSVIPGANNQEVLVGRLMFLEQLIDFHWSVKVLLIPPSCNIQCRNRDFVQPGRKCLPLPERIVVGMIDEVVPGRKLVVKILFICVRKRAQLQVPLVSIKIINDLRHIGYLF